MSSLAFHVITITTIPPSSFHNMIVDFSKVYTHLIFDDILSSYLCLLVHALAIPVAAIPPVFKFRVQIILSCFLCTTRTCVCSGWVFISFLSHFGHGKSFWKSVSAEQATLNIAFVGVKLPGKDHRGWFTEASSLIILAFYGMEGERSGIFPFAFGFEFMGSGDAIALSGLALGVDLHSRSVCLVFFVPFFLLLWKRRSISSSSFSPSLDFDSMGAGYHHMSVVRTILTPCDSGSSYCVLIDDALGRADGFILSLLFAFKGHLSYRSISLPPGYLTHL